MTKTMTMTEKQDTCPLLWSDTKALHCRKHFIVFGHHPTKKATVKWGKRKGAKYQRCKPFNMRFMLKTVSRFKSFWVRWFFSKVIKL
jgi:hypothetical protein